MNTEMLFVIVIGTAVVVAAVAYKTRMRKNKEPLHLGLGGKLRWGIAPGGSVVRARHMSEVASKSPTLPWRPQLQKPQLFCLQAVAAFLARTGLWQARCKMVQETKRGSLLEELRKRFGESETILEIPDESFSLAQFWNSGRGLFGCRWSYNWSPSSETRVGRCHGNSSGS